jgi:hypothetical protein
MFLLLARIYRPTRSFILWGLLLPAVLIGSWAAYLYFEPGAFGALQQDLTDTFIESAHPNPWYYYFHTLPLVLLPAVLIPVFWFKKLSGKIATLESRCAWTWLAVTFILLSLAMSKQRHYALLLIPPAAWVLALHLEHPLTRKHFRILLLIVSLVSLGEWTFIAFSGEHLNKRFLEQVRPHTVDAKYVHVVGVNSAIFDFHLGRHVENIDDPHLALIRATSADAVVVVMKREHWKEPLPEAFTVLDQSDADWIRKFYVKKLY